MKILITQRKTTYTEEMIYLWAILNVYIENENDSLTQYKCRTSLVIRPVSNSVIFATCLYENTLSNNVHKK